MTKKEKMKKKKTASSTSERVKNRWAKHIRYEKELSESSAQWMAEQIEQLLEYLQYGNAAVAYYKQNGTFCLVRATLRHYHAHFGKPFVAESVRSTLVYQDVDQQRWGTFRIENFLAWKPIM